MTVRVAFGGLIFGSHRSGSHAQVPASAIHNRRIANVLLPGRLQVRQVLFERTLIKLRQELGVRGNIEPSDIINQLTLAHMMFSVGTGSRRT